MSVKRSSGGQVSGGVKAEVRPGQQKVRVRAMVRSGQVRPAERLVQKSGQVRIDLVQELEKGKTNIGNVRSVCSRRFRKCFTCVSVVP